VLHGAFERPGTELRAEAFLGQELECRLVPLDCPRPRPKATTCQHLRQLALEQGAHLLALERPEDDDPVDAVAQLGPEDLRYGPLDRSGPKARVGIGDEAETAATLDSRSEVRGQNDDALPEVRGPTSVVGEAAVIEELEEDVPDLSVRLLELVEQHDGERIASHGGDERSSFALLHRVGEQAIEAVGCLKLAHVESNQPIGGTEEEFGERLRELGLAGSGGADEQEDAERARRISQAGFDQRNSIDDRVDCFRLADDPSGEKRADRVEIERCLRIDDVQRQAGCLRQRPQKVCGADFLGAFGVGRRRRLQEAKDAPRRCNTGEVVLGEVERIADRRVVDVGAGSLTPVLRDATRLFSSERLEPERLEHRRDARPFLEHAVVGARLDLPDHENATGLEVRKEPIEDARSVVPVLGGLDRLFERRHHPQHRPAGGTVGDLAQACLDLAHVDLSGHELRRAGFEAEPAFSVEPAKHRANYGGLPDSVFADQEGRVAPGHPQCRLEGTEDFRAAADGHEGRLLVRRSPDAPDAAEELRVGAPAPPLLEVADRRRRKNSFQFGDYLSDGLFIRRLDHVEVMCAQLLAGPHAAFDESGDDSQAPALRPVVIGAGEHACDQRRLHVPLDCIQEEEQLAGVRLS
jgi:hypothetical protein